MELPVKAVRLIKSFSWLDLAVTDLIQLECVGLGGYYNELQITAVAPAVIVLLLSIVALVREAVTERTRGWELVRGAFLRALPWVLLVTFLVVPDVSSLAFQVFRCECFEDEGASYLRADYSLQCTVGGCGVELNSDGEHWTAVYSNARFSAWVALLVYATCVPCFYAVLLFLARDTIMSEESSPLADSLGFLHGDFKPSRYWWELANVVHKLIVVGYATLILSGTMWQLVIVMIIMIAFQMLLVFVRPYRTAEAFLLALVEQACLLLFVVLCFIVKAEQLSREVPDIWMTDEVHKRYFYDTESISSVMICTLSAAVTFAALVSLHQVAPVAMQAWQEAYAFGLDEEKPHAGRPDAKVKAAALVRARVVLRNVLDRQVSTLEVPEFLHSEEAETNPVMLLRIAEANERAKVRRAMLLQQARPSQSAGASSSKRPKRLDGALRKLNIEVQERQVVHTTETRLRVLQRQLERHHGVHSLVKEERAPEEVDRLRRRLCSAARTDPLAHAREKQIGGLHERQMLQLNACREQLEEVGWQGAEKMSPRTRWLITRQLIRQGRLSDISDGPPTPRLSDGAPRAPPHPGAQGLAEPPALQSSGSSLDSLDRVARISAMSERSERWLDSARSNRSSTGSCQQKLRDSKASMEGGLQEDARRARRRSIAEVERELAEQSLGDNPHSKEGPGRWTSRAPRAKPKPRPPRSGAESWRQARLKFALRRPLAGDFSSDSVPRLPVPSRPDVGQRIEHPLRGPGVIAEILDDGRTRVDFDSGQTHRYHPRSLHKIMSSKQLQTCSTPCKRPRPAGQTARGATSRPGLGTSRARGAQGLGTSRDRAAPRAGASRDHAFQGAPEDEDATQAAQSGMPRSAAERWRHAKVKFSLQRPLAGDFSSGPLPRLPVPARPAVGTRIEHPYRGPGVIAEIMEDGRTRVDFDNGQTHRYHPRSLHKVVNGKCSCSTPRKRARPPGQTARGGSTERVLEQAGAGTSRDHAAMSAPNDGSAAAQSQARSEIVLDINEA